MAAFLDRAGMAPENLPVLIVGDVHGDLERLFEALRPYPADRWHTVFVGDLVDYGMFGVGALRYARDRANTTVLIGNHEVAMLWALRDPSRVGFWMSIGGQQHDLDELARDASLQAWLRERDAMVRLADATLVQHCGHDGYSRWIDKAKDVVQAINARARDLLMHEGEPELWDVLSWNGDRDGCKQPIVAASCSATRRTVAALRLSITTAKRSTSTECSADFMPGIDVSRP